MKNKIYDHTKKCPICGSDKLECIGKKADQYLIKFNKYTQLQKNETAFPEYTIYLSKCNDCKVVFVNPRLSESALKLFYEIWYTKEYGEIFADEKHINERILEFNKFHRVYVDSMAKKHINLMPAERFNLLDVGCGTGLFLKTLDNQMYKKNGVEAFKDAAESASKMLENDDADIVNNFFSAGLFPENSFDIITMFDFLEHSESPFEMVKASAGCLKKNGILIIRVPNYDSWQAKFSGCDWDAVICDHLFYFNAQTLAYVLNKNGFEVVSTYAGGYKSLDEYIYEKIKIIASKLNKRIFKKSNAQPDKLKSDGMIEYSALHLTPDSNFLKRYLLSEVSTLIDMAGSYFNAANMITVTAVKK